MSGYLGRYSSDRMKRDMSDLSRSPAPAQKPKRPPKQYLWIEEYHDCDCTFIAGAPHDLPGYCGRHTSVRCSRTRIRGEGLTPGWCRS